MKSQKLRYLLVLQLLCAQSFLPAVASADEQYTVLLYSDNVGSTTSDFVEFFDLGPSPRPELVLNGSPTDYDPSRTLLLWLGDANYVNGELNGIPKELKALALRLSLAMQGAGPISGANPMIMGRDCFFEMQPPTDKTFGLAVSVGIEHISNACVGIAAARISQIRNWVSRN